jgi:uncharacterized membrane protein
VAGKLWLLAHQGGFFPIAGFPSPIVWAHYPVLPWTGIMAVGFALARLYTWPAARRRRALVTAALGMAAAFVVLRSFNIYGDPRPWAPRGDLVRSAMAFFDVEKYPPSLLFSLITLAPSLLVLGLLDGWSFQTGLLAKAVTFGRVPLFFYVLQWPTAHLSGILVTAAQGKDVSLYFKNILDLFQLSSPPDIGGPLWVVYLCWAAGILLLYWPCRWFAGVKARRREWWLSYL